MTIDVRIVQTYVATCDDCGEELDPSPTRIAANNRLKFHSQTDCVKNDHRCDHCSTTLRSCSRRLVRSGKACCEECAEVETHGVTFEQSCASSQEAREWLKERAK